MLCLFIFNFYLLKTKKIPKKVKAGAPVDATIDQVVKVFEKGDVIVDGGNSHFPGQDFGKPKRNIF